MGCLADCVLREASDCRHTSLPCESNRLLSSSLFLILPWGWVFKPFMSILNILYILLIIYTIFLTHVLFLLDLACTHSDVPLRSITDVPVRCQKVPPPRKLTQTPWVWYDINQTISDRISWKKWFGLLASSFRKPALLSWVVSPRKVSPSFCLPQVGFWDSSWLCPDIYLYHLLWRVLSWIIKLSNLTRTRHQVLPISLAKMNVIDGAQKGCSWGRTRAHLSTFLGGWLENTNQNFDLNNLPSRNLSGIHWMTFQKHACKRMLLSMMFLIAEEDMGFVK